MLIFLSAGSRENCSPDRDRQCASKCVRTRVQRCMHTQTRHAQLLVGKLSSRQFEQVPPCLQRCTGRPGELTRTPPPKKKEKEKWLLFFSPYHPKKELEKPCMHRKCDQMNSCCATCGQKVTHKTRKRAQLPICAHLRGVRRLFVTFLCNLWLLFPHTSGAVLPWIRSCAATRQEQHDQLMAVFSLIKKKRRPTEATPKMLANPTCNF